MMNGMINILLAKTSMNGLTSMVGLTKANDAGSGLNLQQLMVSTIANWDCSTMKTKASKLKKDPNCPTKEQRLVFDKYVTTATTNQRAVCRARSVSNTEPIVVSIMEFYSGPKLSEAQISVAQQYLSLHLAIENRRKIVKVLCNRKPDLMTQATREIIPPYMPIIRQIHEAVNLSHTVSDIQAFQDDLLKLPIGDPKKEPPSVEDFLRIMRKHAPSQHAFLHELFSKGPGLRDTYKEFAKAMAEPFKVKSSTSELKLDTSAGVGRLISPLEQIISKLTAEQLEEVLAEAAAHNTYLRLLERSSNERATEVILRNRNTTTKADKKAVPRSITQLGPGFIGPGMFLKRWTSLLEQTHITPMKVGQVRFARDESVIEAGHFVAGNKIATSTTKENDPNASPPCQKILEYLAPAFRQLIINVNKTTI